MADNNLPSQAPAPNGEAPQTPPSVPAAQPADATPASTTPEAPVNLLDSLTDDDKKYLQSQGVTDINAEALQKVINHARSSQKTAADLKNKLDAVNKSINPDVQTDTSSQPQPGGSPAPATTDTGIDQVTAFTLTNQLATQFTHLKDDLVSGKFYKDMQTMGIPLKDGNGQVNLNGLLTYGKMINDQRELEAKLAEAGKPGEGAIPDATPTTPQQPAADAPLTKQLAYAIVATGGKEHPRFDEAKQWLQQNVAKG